MDNQLFDLEGLKPATYRKLGLSWLFQDENADYLADEYLLISGKELDAYQEAADAVQQAMEFSLKRVVEDQLWARLHIPEFCVPLLKYSIKNEWDDHLVGRFDFAGGIDNVPIKLIEYNADTCSLMPETAVVQGELFKQQQIDALEHAPLATHLAERWKEILAQNPDFDPTLLISTSGHQEDWLNVDVIGKAAEAAGFTDVKYLQIDKVIFSEEEGFFYDLGQNEYQQFDFWFKQMPWDFFATDEPELWRILETIVTKGLGKVINPAYTMILQNKAFLPILFQDNPRLKYLLKATSTAVGFMDEPHFKKPIFGRMGENIEIYNRNHQKTYSTSGDYGKIPNIYQQVAQLNRDRYGHNYQPSVYWTGEPSGVCFRRQDDPVIDDDAEYVPSYIRKDLNQRDLV